MRSDRPYIGYLLTCARTGTWPGSVQVPRLSLSHRLPALVVWLSFGLRGLGAANLGEAGVSRRPLLLASWLHNNCAPWPMVFVSGVRSKNLPTSALSQSELSVATYSL